MKKAFLFVLTVLISMTITAQQTEKKENKENPVNVPAVVKGAFVKDFPAAKNAEWGMEDKDFEAEFQLNGVATSANYNKEGHRLETETTIKNDQLPKAALDYIGKNFPGSKITEAAKTIDDKNVTTFEALLEIKKESVAVVFDASGKFLEKEGKEAEEPGEAVEK
jgi:hypothetical protein